LGYVGRFSHIKGVDILAAAFRELTGRCPNARLVIIGSGEEEHSIRSQLQEEIARGLAHMEGDVDHDPLGEWYRSIDLLVMPSRYENYSNTILEALGCAIPFLASDVGGNRIIAETGGGWLFEPESVSSLVAKSDQILPNPSELKTRGKVGREFVEREHLWSKTAQRLEQIMKRLIGEN